MPPLAGSRISDPASHSSTLFRFSPRRAAARHRALRTLIARLRRCPSPGPPRRGNSSSRTRCPRALRSRDSPRRASSRTRSRASRMALRMVRMALQWARSGMRTARRSSTSSTPTRNAGRRERPECALAFLDLHTCCDCARKLKERKKCNAYFAIFQTIFVCLFLSPPSSPRRCTRIRIARAPTGSKRSSPRPVRCFYCFLLSILFCTPNFFSSLLFFFFFCSFLFSFHFFRLPVAFRRTSLCASRLQERSPLIAALEKTQRGRFVSLVYSVL